MRKPLDMYTYLSIKYIHTYNFIFSLPDKTEYFSDSKGGSVIRNDLFYVPLFSLSPENIFSTVVLAFSTWILVALHWNADVLTCAASSFHFVDFRFMVVGFEFDKPFYSHVQPINNIAEGWCLIPRKGRKRQSKLSIDSQTADSVDKKWWKKKGLGCINVDSRSFMSGR